LDSCREMADNKTSLPETLRVWQVGGTPAGKPDFRAHASNSVSVKTTYAIGTAYFPEHMLGSTPPHKALVSS
jgi:hypothetical protein